MAAVMSPAISIAGIYFMYKGSAYKKERVRWNGSAALVYHHQRPTRHLCELWMRRRVDRRAEPGERPALVEGEPELDLAVGANVIFILRPLAFALYG